MVARQHPNKKPLHVYAGGLVWNRRIRRILELAGYNVAFGMPKFGCGTVGIWGKTPRSWRGEWVAKKRNAAILTLEDAFLRSVKTGREGVAPVGLILDKKGVYFDCSAPSDLEDILNYGDLDAGGSGQRGAQALALYRHLGLSKYNAFNPDLPPLKTGYVLVIDQTRGDASIKFGGASDDSFRAMLKAARQENPTSRIVIKTHPETLAGHRRGYFTKADEDARLTLVTTPMSPARLFEGAASVYVVTSLLGFEAILHGHRPRVFGRPFYAGWGLSEDEQTCARRERLLTPVELFAGAMLIYPTWYDPYADRLCDFETAALGLAQRARAWREDHQGYAALGMRLWKRRSLRRFFPEAGPKLHYYSKAKQAAADGARGLVWASKETGNIRASFKKLDRPLWRLEDGFLRSHGLGAELVEPMSLVIDDLGIYYDPTRESRLERMLNASDALPQVALARAMRLRKSLISSGLSKYNVGDPCAGDTPPPDCTKILVAGQVEDDASILKGAGDIRQNIDLIKLARDKNPHAFIAYKPHPDVEKGLREGSVDEAQVRQFANAILRNTDPIAALLAADEIWTMTSLIGFEALLRGRRVLCAGTPFYAGWGLTTDLMGPVPNRIARPSLDALVYCVLIDYPRYMDPITGLACPVEVVAERLARGETGQRRPVNRTLARLQGLFASATPFWR